MRLKSSPIKESYYLSEHNSKLLEDGSLEIELKIGKVTCYIKITSWNNGVNIYGYTDKDKKKLFEPIKPPPINLITVPHENKKLPVYHYLKNVPKEIKLLIGNYLNNQLLLLQACSHITQASDLIQSNPNLLLIWFYRFVIKKNINMLSHSDFYFSKKQKQILSLVVHQNCTESHVKILKKIKLDKSNEEELDLICSSFDNEFKCINQLKHFRLIPVELLNLLGLVNNISKIPLLVNTINNIDINNLNERNQLSMIIKLIKDIVLMNVFGDNEGLKYCRTLKKLNEFHDEIVNHIFEYNNIPIDSVFVPQPIQNLNGCIEAIKNQRQLSEERKFMHHCVAYLGSKMRDTDESYVYRVLKPERATLLITYSKYQQRYQIEECKLACNQEPSKETYDFIQQWLDREYKNCKRNKLNQQ